MFTDKNKIFTVKGHVIDQKTRKGVKGLRVEVWDKDILTPDDSLGEVVTDEQGFFQVTFDESQFSFLFLDCKPDLYFRIFRNEVLIKSTRKDEIHFNVDQYEYQADPIEIDLGDIVLPGQYVVYSVSGVVRDRESNLLSGYKISAFDLNQTEIKLGDTQSDQLGFYSIKFSEAAFNATNPGRTAPNLIVRVYDKMGYTIGESRHSNAPRDTILNIDVGSMKNFIVHGRVLDKLSNKAISDITVCAFDRYEQRETSLGNARSDQDGFYQIEFSESDFNKNNPARTNPNLIVHAFIKIGTPIGQSKLIINASRITELNVEIELYQVYGTVVDDKNKPIKDILVLAYEKDLRKQQILGEDITDANGRFRIDYLPKDFQLGDIPTNRLPWLIVEAYEKKEKPALVSQEFRRALTIQSAELIIPSAKTSEWQRIAETIEPLLDGQGAEGKSLPPWDLTDEDIPFLIEETNLEYEQIRLWILAFQTAHATNLLGETNLENELESILFYGWFREGQPQDFSGLIKVGSVLLIDSLERAIEQRYIPSIDAGIKTQIKKNIDDRQVKEAILPAAENEPASLGDVFKTMSQPDRLDLENPQGLGAKIVSILIQQDALPLEEKWQRINSLIDDNTLFNSVRRSVGLMQLTDAYQPMIKALQLDIVKEAEAVLVDLVKYNPNYWISKAREIGAPASIQAESNEVRATIYGKLIAEKIELMHPTAYINHRIIHDQIPVKAEDKRLLTEFLNANSILRFKDGSILLALESDLLKSGGLSDEQIKSITPELLRIERVAKLTTSLDYAGPLMRKGIESARDIIYAYDRDVFIDALHSIVDSPDASAIYDKANSIVATTEALALSYSPHFNAIDIPVIPSINSNGTNPQTPGNTVAFRSFLDSANLQQLFGNQDYCECSHGASIYGPAAYLADLLQMLARGPQNIRNQTPLNVLLARRPDLAEIDLTSENIDITLPYIDLVLEILEAPENLVIDGSASGFDSDLAQGKVPESLKTQSKNKFDITLGDDIDVRGQPNGPWHIREKNTGLKYKLQRSTTSSEYILNIFRQSTNRATQHFQPWSNQVSDVVKKVSEAKFPWQLPFDGTRDEANTWLKSQKTTRADLMKAAIINDPWNDINLACEFLNISPNERIIFNTLPEEADRPRHWGFESTTAGTRVFDPIAGIDRSLTDKWYEILKHVSLLRARANLKHRELLNLLETRFIRENSPNIEITGEECNSAKMELNNMSASLAHRIHIFVRLWRKLGWDIFELDHAIQAYKVESISDGYAAFTDSFLLFLSNINQLQKYSKLSISQLLDLFSKPSLETTEYWNHAGRLPQRVMSRYQYWFDNPKLGQSQQPEFRLNGTRDNLISPPRPLDGVPKSRISDHLSYIAAALTIPESQLSAILPQNIICIAPSQIGPSRQSCEISGVSKPEFEILIGDIPAGESFSLLIESSEDGQVFVPVSPAFLPPGEQNPSVISNPSPPLKRMRYSGPANYLRCTVTPQSGNASKIWITVRLLTTPGLVPDELSITNLTALCRYALLSRILGMAINEVQDFLTLSANISFETPQKILALIEQKQALNLLGFSINQADQLLLGPDETVRASLNTRVETFLRVIRAEYQAIQEESTAPENKRSNLLKTVLTAQGWNEQLIANILGIEGLAIQLGDYKASLDAMPNLPPGTQLPQSITYDPTAKILTAPRSIRPEKLKNDIEGILSNFSGNLLSALNAILNEADRRELLLKKIQGWMRAKILPVHKVELSSEPDIVRNLPSEWKGRFYYDRSLKKLCLVGWISEADKVALKSFEVSPPPASSKYAAAIDKLLEDSQAYTADGNNQLIVLEQLNKSGFLSVETLLLDTSNLDERCNLVLDQLIVEWRQRKLRSKIVKELSQQLSIAPESAEALLLLPCKNATNKTFEQLLSEASLLASSTAVPPTHDAFEQAYDAAARLLLLGSIAIHLDLESTQISWLAQDWTNLNLTLLPTQRKNNVDIENWSALLKLADLIALRSQDKLGDIGLQKILDTFPLNNPTINYSSLSKVLKCNEETLRTFMSGDGFNIGPSIIPAAWFKNPSNLLKLVQCLQLVHKLNIPAALFIQLKRAQLISRPPREAVAEAHALRLSMAE